MKLIAIREVDYTSKKWTSGSRMVQGIAYFKTFFGNVVEVKFRSVGDPDNTHRNYRDNKSPYKYTKEWLGDFFWAKEPKEVGATSNELKQLLKTLEWMWRHPEGTKTHWVDPKYQDKLDDYLKVPEVVEEEKPETTGPFR